jgi:hypothetical protein
MPPSPAQHLDFEPRAGDFLELLRDLGHLDDAGMDRLTSLLVAQPRASRTVTFEEVRRVAAGILFDREAALRPEQRELLAAEWPRLFG